MLAGLHEDACWLLSVHYQQLHACNCLLNAACMLAASLKRHSFSRPSALHRCGEDGGGRRAVNPSFTVRGSGSKEQNRLGLAGGERPELRGGLGKIIESPGHDPVEAPEAPSCIPCCHESDA